MSVLAKHPLFMLAGGMLAAAFAMTAGQEELPAYCYSPDGQAVLSGRLGADGSGRKDRGLYIAYYKRQSGESILAGYKEGETDMRANNQEVATLCGQIAKGRAVNLPGPATL